jgi:hypothetical protein
MPDWIGDQMAGVGPEAMRVFGRNPQIVVIRDLTTTGQGLPEHPADPYLSRIS